ncbi:TcaA second domain-containing protein, partial [Staphylococcus epidermidis]|uniref:TcaA second domain-containing protein n=1 Tax=Staphylococcus epidermidis TaxID=1282 RepID=UPI0037DA43F6
FTIPKNQISPQKQPTHIPHPIKKNHPKSLSNQLTSNHHPLNQEEPPPYLNYIKPQTHLNHLPDKLQQNTKHIKNNH